MVIVIGTAPSITEGSADLLGLSGWVVLPFLPSSLVGRSKAETIVFVAVRARSRGDRLLLFPLATSCPVLGIFLPPELGLQERCSSSHFSCQPRPTRLQRRCSHDVYAITGRTTRDGCWQDRVRCGRSRTSDRQRVRSGFE